MPNGFFFFHKSPFELHISRKSLRSVDQSYIQEAPDTSFDLIEADPWRISSTAPRVWNKTFSLEGRCITIMSPAPVQINQFFECRPRWCPASPDNFGSRQGTCHVNSSRIPPTKSGFLHRVAIAKGDILTNLTRKLRLICIRADGAMATQAPGTEKAWVQTLCAMKNKHQ